MFFSYLLIVTLVLPSLQFATGDIILDTTDDYVAGWLNVGCIYGNSYNDSVFDTCRVNVTGDNEGNAGFWSFCKESQCSITYTIKEEDETITAMRIMAYVVPSYPVAGSPTISTRYYNVDEDDGSNYHQFPVVGGWVTIEYEFTVALLPGAIIRIRQTGVYPPREKEFSMIDRIILSKGLGPTSMTPEVTATVTPSFTPSFTPTFSTVPTQTSVQTTTQTPPICSTTTFRTTTEGTGIQCPPEGIVFLPHPADCAKFYICAEGEAFPAECATGLLFDAELGKCNIGSEVNCEIIPECPNQDGISFLPIVGTCRKYLICVAGTGTILECAEGTEFSAEAGKCVLGFEYDCPYTRSLDVFLDFSS